MFQFNRSGLCLLQEKKAEEAQKELEKLNAQVGGQQQEQDGGVDVGSTS